VGGASHDAVRTRRSDDVRRKGTTVILKSWNADTGRYDVTFDLPGGLDIDSAVVVGDFNDWDDSATPMARQHDGRLAAVVSLEAGGRHRFRYHLSRDRWENDWSADDYVPNGFGGADSVVEVPDAPSRPPAAKKATAKRAGTKKTAAKEATAKRAGTNKTAAKKTVAQKAATKKPVARKTAASKVAKKSAPRRATKKS
jgi:hypothetical protein